MSSDVSSLSSPGASAPERLILIPLLAFLALLPPETRWESMLAVAVCGALLVLTVALRYGPRPGTGLLIASVPLVFAVVATAPAPGAGVQPVALFLMAASVGLAATTPGLRESGPRVAMTIATLGGLVSIHAVYQKLWGLKALAAQVAANPALPDQHALLERTIAGRAFANFSTPAALGGYLVLALPVTALLASSKTSRHRGILWGLAALQLVGLLSTASATATAALIVVLVLAAFVWGQKRAVIGGAVLILALVLVSAVVLRGGKLVSLTDPNSPWRLRAGNFRSAATMALDHPWRGVGPGGFAEHYPAYRLAGDNETRHAHNLPLEFAAELGLAGGLLGGGALLFLFLMPLVRAREDPEPWRRGLALGLATFAVHNVADYTAFMPSLLLTAVILRGVLAARSTEAAPHDGVGSESPRLWLALGGVGVAVTAALVLALAVGAQDARFRGRMAAFAGDHATAEALAERATVLAPWDIDAAVFRARAASHDPASASPERKRLALSLADRAVLLSPVNPAAREARALARLGAADYPGAYADFAEAAELYPLEPRYSESRDRLSERLPKGASRPEAGS